MRICPVSGEPMSHEKLHDVMVDVSKAGMWLDKGELLAVTEGERHAANGSVLDRLGLMLADWVRGTVHPPFDPNRVLSCPVCGKAMELEEHHDVHLDWCREHGVWLDNGELEAIVNNLRTDPLYLGQVATRLWESRY
jgi:Zn-finger nucleic acid-binding protein